MMLRRFPRTVAVGTSTRLARFAMPGATVPALVRTASTTGKEPTEKRKKGSLKRTKAATAAAAATSPAAEEAAAIPTKAEVSPTTEASLTLEAAPIGDAAPTAPNARAAATTTEDTVELPKGLPPVTTAPTADVDVSTPHALMAVVTKHLREGFRYRNTARHLLSRIEESIDELPVVFLADAAAGTWPAGLFRDSLRVAIRRRVSKGVLDLSGADIARVLTSWSKQEKGDLVMFKRLGKLLAHHINDVRDATTLLDLLRALQTAKLQPPPGFLALLARRLVALDRREAMAPSQAYKTLSILKRFNALDTPTTTALVNRIVKTLRKEIEAAAKPSTAAITTIPAKESEPASAPPVEDVASEAVAKKANVSSEAVEAVIEEDEKPTPAPEDRRDTRWPLAGTPMEQVELPAATVAEILKVTNLSTGRLLVLLEVMQDAGLTSELYSRPMVPLVLPGLRSMHALEAMRFVRSGGMRRIVSPVLAAVLIRRLRPLDLDFQTRAAILSSVVQYHRHLAKTEKRRQLEATTSAEADAPSAAEDTKKNEAAPRKKDPLATFQLLTYELAKDIVQRLGHTDRVGISLTSINVALLDLHELIEAGTVPKTIKRELHAALPSVIESVRKLVDSAAVSVHHVSVFVRVLAQLGYQEAEASALAEVQQALRRAQEEGRDQFESHGEGTNAVFRLIASTNTALTKARSKARPADSFFEDFYRRAATKHPMNVLEGAVQFEELYPKTMAASLKRELSKVLINRLRPADSVGRMRPVPLKTDEWKRFVELLAACPLESANTCPSVWQFVLERNPELGNDEGVRAVAEQRLAIFGRRK